THAPELDPFRAEHRARAGRADTARHRRARGLGDGHDSAPTVARYSTLSVVKVMKASSSEELIRVSSCRCRPDAPARSPIREADMPCTCSSFPLTATSPPSRCSSAPSAPRWGDLTRTYDAACSAMKSDMEQSAR